MYGGPVILVVLLLLLSPCHAESESGGDDTEGVGPTLDSNDPVGSPGELAWQAWLLMDGASDTSSSSTAERRVKPKSVFIAPSFSPQSLPACAEGYRADAMGRCVKLVRLDPAAQFDFLLQRLNSMYGQSQRIRGAPPPTENSGPLQVSLPIEPANKKPGEAESMAEQQQSDLPMEVSVVMADVSKRNSNNDTSEESQEPTITMWSIENNTLPKRESIVAEDTSAEVTDSALKEEDPTTFSIPLPSSDVLAPAEVKGSLPMLILSPEESDKSSQILNVSIASNSSEASNSTNDESTDASNSSEASNSTNDESTDDVSDEDEKVPVTFNLLNLHTGIVDIVNQSVINDSVLNVNNSVVNGFNQTINSSEVYINTSDNKTLPINNTVTQDDDGHLKGNGDKNIVRLLQQVSAPDPEISEISEETTEISHVDDHFNPHDFTFPTENPRTVERSPNTGFVRFPSEVNDDPNTFHMFGRNYVKFPADESFRYETTNRPRSHEKPAYWWLPAGWKVDRQRHQPTLLRFWSRMPLRSDSASYHPSHERGRQSSVFPNFFQDRISRIQEHTRK